MDITHSAGFINVISIKKTSEQPHLVYDTKGCLAVHRISPKKAKYKIFMGTKRVPHFLTNNGETVCYLDGVIVRNTIWISPETGKIADLIMFNTGNLGVATWVILM